MSESHLVVWAHWWWWWWVVVVLIIIIVAAVASHREQVHQVWQWNAQFVQAEADCWQRQADGSFFLLLVLLISSATAVRVSGSEHGEA